MRGTFAALQLFAAFFLTLVGLSICFGHGDFIGPLLSSLGLTFLSLLAINIRTRA